MATGNPELVRASDRQEWVPSTHDLRVIIALAVIFLLVALSSTSTLTSLQVIAQDLTSTPTQASWAGSCYAIACAVSMPLFSLLSDVFGRGIMATSSLGILTLGIMLLSAAENIQVLIMGRTVQGMGAGGISITCLRIFTDIVPALQWSRYYSVIQAAWTIGLLGGPIIGGAVAERTTWKWLFYIHLPTLVGCLVVIPHLRTGTLRAVPVSCSLGGFDWIGGFGFIGSLVLVLISLSWGGSQFPWSSPATIVPLFVGALGIVAALLYQRFVATQPLLGNTFLTSTNVATLNYLSLTQGMIFFGQIYYNSFYFRAVQGFRPMQAGVALIPFTATIVLGSALCNILAARCGTFRYSIWVGWLITSLSAGLLVHWDEKTPPGEWITTSMLTGVGHGCILEAQTFATNMFVGPSESSRTVATTLFLRNLGSALGVILGSIMFQNIMRMQLGREQLPQGIAMQAEKYVPILRDMQDGHLRQRLSISFVRGFQGVHLLLMSSAAVALGISLLGIKRELVYKRKAERSLSTLSRLSGLA